MKRKRFPVFLCGFLTVFTGHPLFLKEHSAVYFRASSPSSVCQHSLLSDLPALYTINTVYIYSSRSAEAWETGKEYADPEMGYYYVSGTQVERGEDRSSLNICHKYLIVRIQESGAVNYTLRHRNVPVAPLSVSAERITHDFGFIPEEPGTLIEVVKSHVQTAGPDALLPGTVLKGLHLGIITETEYTTELREQFRTRLRDGIKAAYAYPVKVTLACRKPRPGESERHELEIKYEQYEFSDEQLKKMETLENAAKSKQIYPHGHTFE